jgi:hypothetical protein
MLEQRQSHQEKCIFFNPRVTFLRTVAQRARRSRGKQWWIARLAAAPLMGKDRSLAARTPLLRGRHPQPYTAQPYPSLIVRGRGLRSSRVRFSMPGPKFAATLVPHRTALGGLATTTPAASSSRMQPWRPLAWRHIRVLLCGLRDVRLQRKTPPASRISTGFRPSVCSVGGTESFQGGTERLGPPRQRAQSARVPWPKK